MQIPSSQITPERHWQSRRQILGLALGGVLPSAWSSAAMARDRLQLNSLEEISRYNNYYEFSTNKEAVWKLAEAFKTTPWTVTVEGAVEQPRTWSLDSLLKEFSQEDRIYPLRCVEGWSMVIPWQGFALGKLIAASRPTSQARYVELVSIERPSEMIGQRNASIPWPYTEGLRIDEAMHPLTILASGLYGKPLPAQNGAPLRLVVPWKYGFKSIKAITRIRLVESQPISSWMRASPSEYGFYANVNPSVAHPRWSQAREMRVGQLGKRPTLPFNGFADEVASLYGGLDLTVNF